MSQNTLQKKKKRLKVVIVFVLETIRFCDGSIVFFQQGIVDTRSAHYVRVCSDK